MSGAFSNLVTSFVNQLLGTVLAQSLIAIPIPQLHLPQTIGPLSLPLPVTLKLLTPTLSETSNYLLLHADLTQ